MTKHVSLLFIVPACLAILASNASAATGAIQGVVSFHNTQGNFCDTSLGMDCTDARYPASQFDESVPWKRVRIEIWRVDSNGVRLGTSPIGTSHTNLIGQFSVTWSYTSTPTRVRVVIVPCHQDNRFCVVNENGNKYLITVPINITPVANQGVNAGAWTLSELSIANVYDGGARVYEEAFRYSGAMQNVWSGVEIRYPDDATQANSGDAQTNGATKTIRMNTDCHRMPMNCVAHEMGHLMSYLLRPNDFCGQYSASFGVTSNEQYCVAFEEGLAQFLAQVSFYWGNATSPRYCIATSACSGIGWNLESSTGSSCTVTQQHMMLTSSRYLWDLYDSIDDSGFVENVSVSYFTLADHIAAWPVGTTNRGNNEPWNSSLTHVDDPSGRAASDYKAFVDTTVSTTVVYDNNCAPGDD